MTSSRRDHSNGLTAVGHRALSGPEPIRLTWPTVMSNMAGSSPAVGPHEEGGAHHVQKRVR